MIQPRRQILLAVPVHTQAGLRNPRQLGGFLDFVGEIAGGITGGILGADAKKAELKNQRHMVQDQLASTERLMQMQVAFGEKQVSAALQSEKIQAQNELAAIDAALAAHLTSQRLKSRVAQEALSTQLVAQTQTGVFGLAQSGLEQSGSLARMYPKAASVTLVLLVLGSAAAIAYMKSGSGRKRRRKGRRFGRRAPAYSPSPSPSYSPSPLGVAS